MHTVIVSPVHDSCLSPNKNETVVFGCHCSGGSAHAYGLDHSTEDTTGLVLMCVHLTLCSSSKYKNLVLEAHLHRVLKEEKARELRYKLG